MSENSPSENSPSELPLEKENIDSVEKTSEPIREIEYSSRITIDYELSLSDAIKSGNYEDINPHIISTDFPENKIENGKKEVIVKLFTFDKEVESQEAIQDMDEQGYRPATFRELMAFGEVNPEVQRYFPINALGTIVNHPKNNIPAVFEIWSYTGKRRVSYNDSIRN